MSAPRGRLSFSALATAATVTVALILAGCGAPSPELLAGDKSHLGSLSNQKNPVDLFGYGLGVDNEDSGTPIKYDLPRTQLRAQMVGFNVKDVAQGTASVDLRALASPVANQARIGACTGFAVAKGLGEFLELKTIRTHGGDPAKDFVPLSANFLYYLQRRFKNRLHEDSGGNIFLATHFLHDNGVAPEYDFPDPIPAQTLDESFLKYYLAASPSADAYADAEAFKGGSLVPIETLSQLKGSLDAGFPVAFAMRIYSSFYDANKTGLVPVPNLDRDDHEGGHAVLAVGYDDARQVLIVRNSWGVGWGDKGYFYLPYIFFDEPLGVALAFDGWTIRK